MEKWEMIEKIVEYANKNKKISDFHLRSGCDFSYREIGEIIVDKSIKITAKNLEELLNKHCTPQDVETFKKFFNPKFLSVLIRLIFMYRLSIK